MAEKRYIPTCFILSHYKKVFTYFYNRYVNCKIMNQKIKNYKTCTALLFKLYKGDHSLNIIILTGLGEHKKDHASAAGIIELWIEVRYTKAMSHVWVGVGKHSSRPCLRLDYLKSRKYCYIVTINQWST